MAEDLRHRYAAAILARLTQTTGPTPSDYDLADAVMAVRDGELERLRAQLPQCNGLCLRASDVLDDLGNVVGDPVARAHRSCPLHGDLEVVAWELDAALNKAEAEREALRERAERAEAVVALTRERLDALIAAGFGAVTDTLRELRAALDDTPEA